MSTNSEEKIHHFHANSKGKEKPLRAFSKEIRSPTASNSSHNSDEDDLLSYKKMGYNKNGNHNSFSKKVPHPRKKSGNTIDFKTKWKTEICHFWEMNGYCPYGGNVSYAFNSYLVCVCSWSK